MTVIELISQIMKLPESANMYRVRFNNVDVTDIKIDKSTMTLVLSNVIKPTLQEKEQEKREETVRRLVDENGHYELF